MSGKQGFFFVVWQGLGYFCFGKYFRQKAVAPLVIARAWGDFDWPYTMLRE